MSGIDHFRAFLLSLGLDPADDDQLAQTPARVTALFEDLFASVDQLAPAMSVFEADDTATGPVIIAGIAFRSMCVHHLVPFFGTVDIAYLPADHIAGFGSFGRVIDWAARKPQIQERMVAEIAEVLTEQMAPAGLLVRCRARQLCVEMRSGRTGTYVSLAASGALAAGGAHYDAVLRQLCAADGAL